MVISKVDVCGNLHHMFFIMPFFTAQADKNKCKSIARLLEKGEEKEFYRQKGAFLAHKDDGVNKARLALAQAYKTHLLCQKSVQQCRNFFSDYQEGKKKYVGNRRLQIGIDGQFALKYDLPSAIRKQVDPNVALFSLSPNHFTCPEELKKMEREFFGHNVTFDEDALPHGRVSEYNILFFLFKIKDQRIFVQVCRGCLNLYG